MGFWTRLIEDAAALEVKIEEKDCSQVTVAEGTRAGVSDAA